LASSAPAPNTFRPAIDRRTRAAHVLGFFGFAGPGLPSFVGLPGLTRFGGRGAAVLGLAELEPAVARRGSEGAFGLAGPGPAVTLALAVVVWVTVRTAVGAGVFATGGAVLLASDGARSAVGGSSVSLVADKIPAVAEIASAAVAAIPASTGLDTFRRTDRTVVVSKSASGARTPFAI
jgi:hypothetical protein